MSATTAAGATTSMIVLGIEVYFINSRYTDNSIGRYNIRIRKIREYIIIQYYTIRDTRTSERADAGWIAER